MAIPSPLPATGFVLPLRAAFVVLRRWPLIGVASNNLNPSLTLFEDRLEHKVMKLKRKSYGEIAVVDARQWMGGHDLILHWRDRWLSLRANFGQSAVLQEALEFFATRNFPLSDAAREILDRARRNGNQTV